MRLVLKNDSTVANMLADRISEKCGCGAACVLIPHPSSSDTVLVFGEGVTTKDVKECASDLFNDLTRLKAQVLTLCANQNEALSHAHTANAPFSFSFYEED